MNKKIICILVMTLLIATAVLPVVSSWNDIKDGKNVSMLNKNIVSCQNGLQTIDLTVGNCDGFNSSPPAEPTSPSQTLLDWIDANYPIPGSRDCDETGPDRFWAHTFDLTGVCCDCNIVKATLIITVKNEDYFNENDALNIGCIDDDSDSWDIHDTLINWGIPVGEDGTIVIDLSGNYSSFFSDMVEHCYIDVIVQDDSVVDCATLTVECCQFSYEFEKKVWDPNAQQWVEKIDAKVCTEVTFGISIVNSPAGSTCPLSNIIVVDQLPNCLEYVQRSSNWKNYLSVVGNKLTWDFGSMVIEAGQSLTILFDAHVISTGLNRNQATFYAYNSVFGSDSAIVIGRINCTDINDLSCPPIAWWPLDSLNKRQDIVGPYNGKLACGDPPTVTPGKVHDCCRFVHHYNNFGVIRTNKGKDPFVDIGNGDFSIDAWIYPEEVGNNPTPHCWVVDVDYCQVRPIVCNQDFFGYRGIMFFVKNVGWDGNRWTSMELGIELGGGNKRTEFLSLSSLPIFLNEWQHVAVTVSRAGNTANGIFYRNGIKIGTFSYTGPLYLNKNFEPTLDIGHGRTEVCSLCGLTNMFFNGLLDEIEIFDCCLSKSDIEAIYNADDRGKCKQYGSKMVSTDKGETWHESVNADVDETVTFKIITVNDGKNTIDNVKVIDTLPDCLEYIEGSAEPVEPTVQGNNLTWNYENIDINETEEIQFDALIIWQPFDPFQYNYMEISGRSAGTILLFDDTATIIIGETVPDLKCSGSLSWSDIKPSTTVEGSFSVENVGEIDSNLYWDIESLPDWGTWTITPFSGENLKPEDGPVEVDVEVEVPDEQNAEFSGEVKIVNRHDSTDNCTIPVSLTTPKNKAINTPFIQFLESLLQNHPYMFPVLRQLLEL